jgi:hypothetical protein
MIEITDLPCWLSNDDKEVANALLELEWIWLEDEEPESWEEQIWERKICKYRGWQFWSVPGEVCLLVSRNGAVFGLCLEAMNPKPDFEGEIKKAKSAISRVHKLQESVKPKQLTLFLLGLLLLCSCTQAKPKATARHWCESSPNPAECFDNQGTISVPCTAKSGNEFQECWDEMRKEDE